MDIKSALLAAFVQYVLPVAATAAAGGLAWALAQLGLWLKTKYADSKLASIATRVAHLASVVVAEVEVAVKPELAKAAADGKVTAEEGAAIKAVALSRLKALLTERGLSELQGVLGILAPQVDGYLSGAIEKAVTAQKVGAAVPT